MLKCYIPTVWSPTSASKIWSGSWPTTKGNADHTRITSIRIWLPSPVLRKPMPLPRLEWWLEKTICARLLTRMAASSSSTQMELRCIRVLTAKRSESKRLATVSTRSESLTGWGKDQCLNLLSSQYSRELLTKKFWRLIFQMALWFRHSLILYRLN